MKRKKYTIITLLILIITLGLGCISYTLNIKNPFYVIEGLVKVEINNKMEKISSNPVILMGKESNSIIGYMNNLGYEFESQEGSGYFFNKGNTEKIIVTSEQFTRKYIIWKMSEMK